MNDLFKIFLLGLAAVSTLLTSSTAKAADYLNLEEGLPTQLSDAIVTAPKNTEMHSLLRWERTDNDDNIFVPEVRIVQGIVPNSQFDIRLPYEFGDGIDDDIGNVESGLMYNFNEETPELPAFAVSGHAVFPTADRSHGLDTRAKFIATKSIASSPFQRIHGNAIWNHNAKDRANERRDYFTWIVGYDTTITKDTFVVLDFVRKDEIQKGKVSNIAEVGVRHQFNPSTVLALGGGVGLGEDSPDFLSTVGVQYTF